MSMLLLWMMEMKKSSDMNNVLSDVGWRPIFEPLTYLLICSEHVECNLFELDYGVKYDWPIGLIFIIILMVNNRYKNYKFDLFL